MMILGMKTTTATPYLQHPTTAAAYPLPTPSSNISNSSRNRPVVAFTTPKNYAGRLSHLLQLKGFRPLWCPTVIVQTTPLTIAALHLHLSNPNPKDSPALEDFSAIAFTSRTGISAFSEALADINSPPLASSGETFTISALGKDAELLDSAFIDRLCKNPRRINVLVPQISTPTGLVESLGFGRGRRVLCPVPAVVGLEEPPVVPTFLRDLASRGWFPARVNAYETRWAGPLCAKEVVRRISEEDKEGLNAVIFTSTGEVDGLLKSLREGFGLEWGTVRMRWPRLVVAAHGPVTAAGAERLGVGVDLVSSRFDSFGGVVDGLIHLLEGFM